MRPFPYASLARVARADVPWLQRAARLVPPVDLDVVVRELEALLGAPVRLTQHPLDAVAPGALHAMLAEPLAALVLEPDRHRVVLELDPRLALLVLDRVLGGEGGADVVDVGVALSDAERGVLAYVATRLLVHAPGTRLRAVVTTAHAVEAAIGDEGATVWTASVSLGADEGVARVIVPRSALPEAARTETTSALLAGLRPELVADVGHARLAPEELASLRQGDVLLLDASTVTLRAGALTGTARVHALGATRTAWICTIETDALMLHHLERTEELAMTEGRTATENTTNLGEALGDLPIEVQLELARFRLPVEELARLRPGEVLLAGRAVGAHVVLRAGDRVVATGELVDVDGELGVRVLRLGDR